MTAFGVRAIHRAQLVAFKAGVLVLAGGVGLKVYGLVFQHAVHLVMR